MITVLASLLSGVVGAFASTWYHISYERTRLKKETLRRFAANRHALLSGSPKSNEEEFSQALNEIIVVFNNDPNVMSELLELHDAVYNGGSSNRIEDKIVSLFREMCAASSVVHGDFDDQHILTPFGTKR
jgi:hypothetical protein